MLNYPKTLEEAKVYKYGQRAGNPGAHQYEDGYCAYEVFDRQCSRYPEYGPAGLYCWQHTKMIGEK